MKVNTEDVVTSPQIGFSLKGAIITSDFHPCWGKREQEEAKDKASGSSDRRAKGTDRVSSSGLS